MDDSFQEMMNDFQDMEQIQRQLGVTVAQLSHTLKEFEILYRSMSKMYQLKRNTYIHMEILNDEKRMMDMERMKFEKELRDMELKRIEFEEFKIGFTADSLINMLQESSCSQEDEDDDDGDGDDHTFYDNNSDSMSCNSEEGDDYTVYSPILPNISDTVALKEAVSFSSSVVSYLSTTVTKSISLYKKHAEN